MSASGMPRRSRGKQGAQRGGVRQGGRMPACTRNPPCALAGRRWPARPPPWRRARRPLSPPRRERRRPARLVQAARGAAAGLRGARARRWQRQPSDRAAAHAPSLAPSFAWSLRSRPCAAAWCVSNRAHAASASHGPEAPHATPVVGSVVVGATITRLGGPHAQACSVSNMFRAGTTHRG